MTGSQQSATDLGHRVALGKRSCHSYKVGGFPKGGQCFQDREKELCAWVGKSQVISPNTTLGQMLEFEHKLGSNTSLDWNACTAFLSPTGPAAHPAAPGLCRGREELWQLNLDSPFAQPSIHPHCTGR